MKKRIFAVLLVVLSLMLTACGQKEYGSFGQKADQVVARLKTSLGEAGYTDMFTEEPEEENMPGDGDTPDSIRRTYLAPGMVLETYSLQSDNQLYQMVLMVEKSALDTPQREQSLEYTLDWLVDTFEHDDPDTVRQALGLPDTAEGIDAQTEGTHANWTYFSEDGFLFLSATAKDYVASLDA